MGDRKFNLMSKFFDNYMGNVIEIRSSYETDSEEYYTENYMGGDEPAYMITNSDILILDGRFMEVLMSMFSSDKKELVEFARYKFKRKIISVV